MMFLMFKGKKRKSKFQTDDEEEGEDKGNLTSMEKLRKKRKCVNEAKKSKPVNSKKEQKNGAG